MDDFKRAIYIEARNRIAENRNTFICVALEKALENTIGYDIQHLTDSELKEFFPEFFAQYDKKLWVKDYKSNVMYKHHPNEHTCWWDETFIQERLAILDLLIDERL